jgi:hypothetical protein
MSDVNLIKIRSTHLLPIFYRFYIALFRSRNFDLQNINIDDLLCVLLHVTQLITSHQKYLCVTNVLSLQSARMEYIALIDLSIYCV